MVYKIRELITRHEGKFNKEYLCPAGKRTIGIGHNLEAHPLPEFMQKYLDEHGEITDEMINSLFAGDVMEAIGGCMKLYPQFNLFSEARRLALVDFLFNVGLTTAKTFINTNKDINAGNWKSAAERLRGSLYWRQLGGDPPGTDDGKLERPEEIYKMILEG